ncbi:hypothetical protein BC829DRAFT_448946 [Chytridium lagenaria]|nr:hypothetical protein BC829DRAFT_448946 [Chytridium lagenaria]
MIFTFKTSVVLFSAIASAVNATPLSSRSRYPAIDRRQAPGDLEQLARTFAPLIRFHPKETYFSTSIDYFLSKSNLKDNAGNRIPDQPALKPSNLDFLQTTRNQDDSGTFISVDGNLEADPTLKPEMRFLEGSREMNGVPIYTVVAPKANGVLALLPVQPREIHPLGRVGNHVGDWELVILRTINGRLISLDFSAHGDSGIRVIPANDNRLQYSGTHPIVYTALGSHGMWPSQGKNTYKTVALVYDLVDETGDGVQWESWRNVKTIPYQNSKFKGDLAWVNFRGRFGNKGNDDCWFYKLTGSCQLGAGPGTLYRTSTFDAPPAQILGTPNNDRTTISFYLDASTRNNVPNEFRYVAVHVFCPGTKILWDSGDAERWGFVGIKGGNDLAYTINTDRCNSGRSRHVDRYEVAFCTAADAKSCTRRSGYRSVRVFNNGAETEVLGASVSDVDVWRF